MRVLSLGAGVQSTTVALMVKHGDLPPIDAAVFADTGWEPKAVYTHLDWLESIMPFPIHRVSAGNLRDDVMKYQNVDGRGRVASVPWFLAGPKGKAGMGRRQCTKDYKIVPIRRKVRELLGSRKASKGAVTQLIGISQDEAWRMKPSRVQYIVHEFPLIDKGMTRQNCLKWISDRQYPAPPKSSCIGCPYHSDEQWRALTPAEFADAVEVDRAIRNQPKMRAQQFMHRSLKPLDQVDLSTAEERGQLNLFLNECEGMCGV